MHNDEIEIQIKIAELQTDIEIYLAISIGLLAAVIAVAAIAFQIYPLMKELDLGIVIPFILLVILEFVMTYYTQKSVDRMIAKRNELKRLREKYAW